MRRWFRRLLPALLVTAMVLGYALFGGWVVLLIAAPAAAGLAVLAACDWWLRHRAPDDFFR